MHKVATILILLVLVFSAVAVWAEPLLESPDGCCGDCDQKSGDDCCQNFVCCHSAPMIGWLPLYTPASSDNLVIGRADLPSMIVVVGELDRSLDLPPRSISC